MRLVTTLERGLIMKTFETRNALLRAVLNGLSNEFVRVTNGNLFIQVRNGIINPAPSTVAHRIWSQLNDAIGRGIHDRDLLIASVDHDNRNNVEIEFRNWSRFHTV
jgi:hypothetical protein